MSSLLLLDVYGISAEKLTYAVERLDELLFGADVDRRELFVSLHIVGEVAKPKNGKIRMSSGPNRSRCLALLHYIEINHYDWMVHASNMNI